jgi:hypothetical protein
MSETSKRGFKPNCLQLLLVLAVTGAISSSTFAGSTLGARESFRRGRESFRAAHLSYSAETGDRTPFRSMEKVGGLSFSRIANPKAFARWSLSSPPKPFKRASSRYVDGPDWTKGQIEALRPFLEGLQSTYPELIEKIALNGNAHLVRAARDGITTGCLNPFTGGVFLFQEAIEDLHVGRNLDGEWMRYYHRLILHELAHAFDIDSKSGLRQVSHSDEFLQLVGYKSYVLSKDHFSLDPTLEKEVLQVRKSRRTEIEKDEWARANGFPSFYAAMRQDPSEVFAEAVVMAHFSPNLMWRANPELYYLVKRVAFKDREPTRDFLKLSRSPHFRDDAQ